MALVPAHPEAEGKYQQYKNVYDDLIRLQGQGKVQQAANASTQLSSNFESSSCMGTYYNTYVTQMQSWCTDAQTITNKFTTANNDFQARVLTVQNLRDHWDQLRRVLVDNGKG